MSQRLGPVTVLMKGCSYTWSPEVLSLETSQWQLSLILDIAAGKKMQGVNVGKEHMRKDRGLCCKDWLEDEERLASSRYAAKPNS
jgi:hypothetical protein